MSETFLFHLRSLCYGVIITFFISLITRLYRAQKKQTVANARFVLWLAIITLGWLAIKNASRFIFDVTSLYTPMADHSITTGMAHIMEMIAIPFMGTSLCALSRLKRTSIYELLIVQLPLFITLAFYPFTGERIVLILSLCYTIVYSLVVITMVHIYVRQYQQLLNETYASTTHRGITWVLTTLYILVALLAMWVISAFVLPSTMSDCCYFLLSMIPWGFYSHRLLKQNFNIQVMQEIANDKDSVEDEQIMETENTGKSAQPQALKVWQEPKFGEAIHRFCSEESNFANTDLSIMDVARAVNSNRTYVSRWCKEQGTDFSNYIIGIRLDFAEQLLLKTNYQITDIVTMSGFSNSRHFRTVFFARHQCTPTEYRAMNALKTTSASASA